MTDNHVMKDPAAMPEHGALTQRFIAAIVVAVIAAIVTLGLLAVRYGATDAVDQLVLLFSLFVTLAIAIVAAVFAARYSHRINQLAKR